jgi:hypothetical protein
MKEQTREPKQTSNQILYEKICWLAYHSVFWSRKAQGYIEKVYHYAPMIRDGVFLSLYNSGDIVGSYDIEQKLGRRLFIEELVPCTLSCYYFLYGKPHLSGSETEAKILGKFKEIIESSVIRNEVHAVRWEGGHSKPKEIELIYYDEQTKQLKRERRA